MEEQGSKVNHFAQLSFSELSLPVQDLGKSYQTKPPGAESRRTVLGIIGSESGTSCRMLTSSTWVKEMQGVCGPGKLVEQKSES